MKKQIEDKLKELIEERERLEGAYLRVIGGIATCQELLKEKDKESK